jgi:hypothetical protein
MNSMCEHQKRGKFSRLTATNLVREEAKKGLARKLAAFSSGKIA